MAISILAVVSALLAALGARAALQRSVARQLTLAAPPGVVEEGFVTLGGLEQWVSIRGERVTNPVLLVLHGGPGASYTVLTPDLRCWERFFTVVQWDRRGVGKTLGRHGRRGGAVTFERMQADCIELRAVLEQRFPGRPVVLLSSSAGTMVGLPLAATHPSLFAAYVAADFNPGLAACEAVSGPATRAWAKVNASASERRFLDRLGDQPTQWEVRRYQRLAMLRDRSAGPGRTLSAIFLPRMLRSPTHSWSDLRDLVRGLSSATHELFEQMVAFDAAAVAPALELPFVIVQGADDVQTPVTAARTYFDLVSAPTKQFLVLPGRGHMGAFVDPEAVLETLRGLVAAPRPATLLTHTG